MDKIQLVPIVGIGEICCGDDLGSLIVSTAGDSIREGDILVVSYKAVPKAEGNVFRTEDITPSPFAEEVSLVTGKPPAYCELILRESASIVRMAEGVIICRARHGFVMANAGVDASNAGGAGRLITLPKNPDASARQIRNSIIRQTGKAIAIIISDTFGRPWRNGQMNLAVGVCGIKPIVDYRNTLDDDGHLLTKTCIAVADELAAAADLAAGKTGRVPAVLVHGYSPMGEGSVSQLIMDSSKDLFK